MTSYDLDLVEAQSPTEETAPAEAACFVPLLDVAATIGVVPTTVRRMVWNGTLNSREGSEGREVDVAMLPAKYRAAFATRIGRPTPGLREVAEGETAPRYGGARETVRERAEFRYEAALSLGKARAARRPGEKLAQVERRWLRNFRRAHPGRKVSIRSVKAWAQMLAESKGNIDALVDGNDGVKQRGARIPAEARQMFKDEYLRAHEPNLMLIYQNVVTVAKVKGWGEMPSYDTFRRFAKNEVPKLVRRLLRDCADKPRTVLPHVRRDPTSIPAYHTIQSDHREIDVPVRCDKGCEVCTGVTPGRKRGRKPKGHFPIWTAYYDIRSRRLLGSELSIDAPNCDRVLRVFRRVVDENGLPERVYLDNGADYRKAFGKRLRQLGKSEWDGPNEEQLQARFAPVGVEVVYAIVDNAQAKPIERMLLTYRRRFDEDFESYRGSLGHKSEYARELYFRPSELPTLSELAYLLQLAIDDYNATPHSGRGMNDRTPNEVFFDPEIRLPRREPDKAWGYLFFDRIKEGRVVGTNGVQHEGRIYRLTSLQKHLEYFGERVDVRINPDDQRDAMIFDRRTGEFVCRARVDEQDATYDTRDEVTRGLISRVFSDGKALVRMAKDHVKGAKERLTEYRRAKIEYLVERAREHEIERQRAQAVLDARGTVTVIGRFSALTREERAVPIELTASVIEEVLDADAALAAAPLTVPPPPPLPAASGEPQPVLQEAPLCVVSSRKREPKARTRSRHDGALTYDRIAEKLGVTRTSLTRYIQGVRAWPPGMKERYERYAQLRDSMPNDTTEVALPVEEGPRSPRRTCAEGEFSFESIAKALGMHWKVLLRCRQGKRPWPEGMRERFDDLMRQRAGSKS